MLSETIKFQLKNLHHNQIERVKSLEDFLKKVPGKYLLLLTRRGDPSRRTTGLQLTV